jgi:mannitol-1-phosphate 5-dehydrogenase
MITNAKQVVIFGAGATGRGHIGQLAASSGYHLTFVDKDETLVRELAAAGQYTVRLISSSIRDAVVGGYAVHSAQDEAAIADSVASTNLVLTAVLAENLPDVARSLARAITRRAERGIASTLNVVACENMIGGSSCLQRNVLPALDARYHAYLSQYVGFPNAMISRVVPAPTGSRLLLEAEDYNEWPVDRGAFLGEDPGIAGLELVNNLPALLERKLFMHNTGHAVCGYLAYLKGYAVMCDAILDPWIRQTVYGAMTESGLALVQKHGFTRTNVDTYRDDFIPRVAGRLISDPVSRVIRSPRRKIGRNERLIGPACMALDYGLEPRNLALGIAALLRYDAPEDAEAMDLCAALAQQGVAHVLETYAGLDLQRYGRLLTLVQEAQEELVGQFPRRQ